MLLKIKRKDFLEKYPRFPQANYSKNKFSFPDVFKTYILRIDSRSTIGLCKNLAIAFSKLTDLLKFESLTFLGDTTTPWLFSDHDYKPVKLGLDYLIANKLSKRFNGAVQVDAADLPKFLKHLFWLVRCNGIVFYPHCSDPGFNIIANICHHGNIHFYTLNRETDLLFNQVIAKTALLIVENGECT